MGRMVYTETSDKQRIKVHGSKSFNGPARKKFLEVFSETLNMTKAAEICGWHLNTVRKHLRNNEKFKKQLEEARETAIAKAEAEAYRRAVEGTEEPVFFKGEQCGVMRKYSDSLLKLLLSAHNPIYNQNKTNVEITGKDGGPVEVSVVKAKLMDMLASSGAIIDVEPENRLEDQSEDDED